MDDSPHTDTADATTAPTAAADTAATDTETDTATADTATATDTPTADAPHTPTTPRPTLRRSRQDRMLGGVCGGAAEALGVDAALLRIALVALTLLGFGAGLVIYLACWLIVPEE
jgi:phage shock protein PspC (stress-responsive transcriptional regulator)